MDLSEPRALFESLGTRLELYTTITDDTLEATAAYYTPWVTDLEEDVEALCNKFPILYEDLLNKPVLLQGER